MSASDAVAVKGTKDQIAFYASTPAYRAVLDLHGWGELQPELTRLSKEGRWSDMGGAIDDELLHAFAVVGGPAEVGKGLRERCGPRSSTPSGPDESALAPATRRGLRSCRGRRRQRRSAG